MTVEKVTNVGIKLSNGMSVPVIRAVVSDYEGYISPSEANAIMLDVYNKAFGCVTAVGAFQQYHFPYIPSDIEYFNLPEGMFEFGDDSGFKLKTNYYHADGPTTHAQLYQSWLYYEGELLITCNPSGSYDFTTSFMVIFTDENYNLLVPGPDYIIHGVQIQGDSKTSVASYNGQFLVCGLFSDEGNFLDAQISGFSFHTYSNIKNKINNEIEPDPDKDPYDPDGTEGSDAGGGGGNHDLGGDNIDIPPVPGLSAVDTGFITIFNPSLSQLQNLSDYLWSNLFDIDTIKKLFADPMDVFLGLSIVPVDVPISGTKTVKVAGISTGITMNLAARQYVEVDCGSITVSEYWGAYLDYDPYTKAELYLPYIGIHAIAIDDIMGKTITIKYHVDILSGACVAYVKCGTSVLYSFIGQCASSIPINKSDWTNVINGALNIATAIGTMVATGGASAPMNSATAGEVGGAVNNAGNARRTAAMIRGSSNIASTAVNVMKPSIEKSGAISGTGGMMAIQKPYLIITRPKQAVPTNQKHYMGYPSFITSMLGALSGYTEMEYIHLEGLSATDEELSEIESLLKGGVYL